MTRVVNSLVRGVPPQAAGHPVRGVRAVVDGQESVSGRAVVHLQHEGVVARALGPRQVEGGLSGLLQAGRVRGRGRGTAGGEGDNLGRAGSAVLVHLENRMKMQNGLILGSMGKTNLPRSA